VKTAQSGRIGRVGINVHGLPDVAVPTGRFKTIRFGVANPGPEGSTCFWDPPEFARSGRVQHASRQPVICNTADIASHRCLCHHVLVGFTGNAVARPPALIRDQVAAQIRDAITNLELLPGQVLSERELCAATTASRATVREALRQLQSEGLIVSTNGRGSAVAKLSADAARQLYEVRSQLEGLAGRLFAERASESDKRALRMALINVEEAVEDTREMAIAKNAFYDSLVVGSANIELKQLLDAINRRVTAIRAISLSKQGRPVESIAEVRAICDAAVAGDAELTEKLCRQHVENAAAAALPQLAK
jgi:DNA-binding GntR family transcriptional regulator